MLQQGRTTPRTAHSSLELIWTDNLKRNVYRYFRTFKTLSWHFIRFFFFVSRHPAAAASGHLAPLKRFGLLKFPCVLFWPMWPAWKARQGGGWVNVSYTRLLMRPETKERADTIIGSALRASFTFYQATAGDMGMWGGRGSWEEPSRRSGEAAGTKKKKRRRRNVLVFSVQTSLTSRNYLSGFSGRSLADSLQGETAPISILVWWQKMGSENNVVSMLQAWTVDKLSLALSNQMMTDGEIRLSPTHRNI